MRKAERCSRGGLLPLACALILALNGCARDRLPGPTPDVAPLPVGSLPPASQVAERVWPESPSSLPLSSSVPVPEVSPRDGEPAVPEALAQEGASSPAFAPASSSEVTVPRPESVPKPVPARTGVPSPSPFPDADRSSRNAESAAHSAEAPEHDAVGLAPGTEVPPPAVFPGSARPGEAPDAAPAGSPGKKAVDSAALAEFRARYATLGKSPEGAVKLYFDAVFHYLNPETRAEGAEMLRYALRAPASWEKSSNYATLVARLRNPEDHAIFRSFVAGARPEDDYRVSTDEYSLMLLSHAPHADYEEVRLRSSGAESPRILWLRQEDGLWFMADPTGSYVRVRRPARSSAASVPEASS